MLRARVCFWASVCFWANVCFWARVRLGSGLGFVSGLRQLVLTLLWPAHKTCVALQLVGGWDQGWTDGGGRGCQSCTVRQSRCRTRVEVGGRVRVGVGVRVEVGRVRVGIRVRSGLIVTSVVYVCFIK